MVGHDEFYKGDKIDDIKNTEELMSAMLAKIPSNLTNDDIWFVCIGTDRANGDALAPFVGKYLKEKGYTNVTGEVGNTCNAVNLIERLQEVPKGKTVIAIDATLGMQDKIKTFSVYNGSIKPGAGVGKELPYVGHYSITGTTGIEGFMPYFVLMNTKLDMVVEMAKQIVNAIDVIFPLSMINENTRKNNNVVCLVDYKKHLNQM